MTPEQSTGDRTGPNFGPVRQLGHVVADLDAAVSHWTARLGVGPWTIMRNIELGCSYYGRRSHPLIDIALAYRGEQQIELIQQKNDAESPYRTFIDRGRYGLHHIAFLTEQIDADVARGQAAGLVLACDIHMPAGGGRYVYFESPVPGEGTFIELLDATVVMKKMFALGMANAAGWQGQGKPVDINLGPVLGLMRSVSGLFRRR